MVSIEIVETTVEEDRSTTAVVLWIEGDVNDVRTVVKSSNMVDDSDVVIVVKAVKVEELVVSDSVVVRIEAAVLF